MLRSDNPLNLFHTGRGFSIILLFCGETDIALSSAAADSSIAVSSARRFFFTASSSSCGKGVSRVIHVLKEESLHIIYSVSAVCSE
jgi:hypothetical protein